MGEFHEDDIKRVEALFPIYEAPEKATAVMKTRFRALALAVLDVARNATTPEAKRSAALALTEIETASMYAVKALHQG